MPMGAGIVAIDVDPRNGGDVTWAKLQAEHGELSRTPRARTGGRGDHHFVAVQGTFKTRKLPGGVELIGDGSYVLVAPSVTAEPYEWIVAPWDCQLAWAPSWVLQLGAKPPIAAPAQVEPVTDNLARRIVRARAYLATMAPAISGSGGHDATWRAALAMVRGFALPTDEAMRLLIDDFNPRCRPPWSERELKHKVDSAAQSDAPAWLASAAPQGKGLASGGADLWAGAIRAVVRRAVPEPKPARDGMPPLTRVRLELRRDDGSPLGCQYVPIPLHGRETVRRVYEAVLGDFAPEVWDGADAWRAAQQLEGRELEIVLEGQRATRMRRIRS